MSNEPSELRLADLRFGVPELVVGILGCGAVGRAIAGLLLDASRCRLIVAGSDPRELRETADAFPGEAGRLLVQTVDVAKVESFQSFMQPLAALVVTEPSKEIPYLAVEALRFGVPYLDLCYSARMDRILDEISEPAHRIGIPIIRGAGFLPGMVAPLIRLLIRPRDQLLKAWGVSHIRTDQSAPLHLRETLVEEIEGAEPSVFSAGKWLTMREGLAMRYVELTDKEGNRMLGRPVRLGELEALAKRHPETTFLGCFVHKDQDQLLPPPHFARLRVRASGTDPAGTEWVREVAVEHTDAVRLTACGAAACLERLLDAPAGDGGVFSAGMWVEPRRILSWVERDGGKVFEEGALG